MTGDTDYKWRHGNAARRHFANGPASGGPKTATRNWVAPSLAVLIVIAAAVYSASNLLPVLAPVEVYPPDRLASAYCTTTFRGVEDCWRRSGDKRQPILYRWERAPVVVVRKVQDDADSAVRHHLYLALRDHLNVAGFTQVQISHEPPLSRRNTIDIRFPPWPIMPYDVQDKTRSLRWGHSKGSMNWVELSLNAAAIREWAEDNTGPGRSYESNLKFYAEAMAATVLGRVVGSRPARAQLEFEDVTVSLETALTALHYDPSLKAGADVRESVRTIDALADELSHSRSFRTWLADRRAND